MSYTTQLHSGLQQLHFTRNYMGAWRTWRRPPTSSLLLDWSCKRTRRRRCYTTHKLTPVFDLDMTSMRLTPYCEPVYSQPTIEFSCFKHYLVIYVLFYITVSSHNALSTFDLVAHRALSVLISHLHPTKEKAVQQQLFNVSCHGLPSCPSLHLCLPLGRASRTS